jgi:hypothetical protein
MTLSRRFWPRTAALLIAALAIGGCVIEPARVQYSGAVVVAAPPAPIVETYGPAPAPGYVWLGGYWNWVGGRHVWVAGHWTAPRPGYHWVPHRWVAVNGGWRLHEGHWARG